MLEAAIEAGADDCALEEGQHVVTCEMGALAGVSQALAKKFGDPASAKFVWRTDVAIPVEGEGAETLMKLLNQLDDLDDVQDVYSNEDISDEELARLSA
jgi:transcriptional/translational regulatory protein YebC/TACO1